MKVIGITGGVGSGKSEVIEFIKNNYSAEVIVADRLSEKLCMKGEACYKPLVELLGKDVLTKDGEIDRKAMALKIFDNDELRLSVNNIIHPAVKEYIVNIIATLRASLEVSYLVIEAALLIECGYKEIVDEMWYIYVSEPIRRQRLKASRGYSDEKIDSIMRSQLSEDAFKEGSDVVIDNSGSIEETYGKIKEILT